MATSTASAAELYSYAKLDVPQVRVFYDARTLSEDGRAGGYIRANSAATPLDLPTVWDSTGTRTTLEMPSGYYRSYVLGFRADGVALGVAEFPPQFPGPGGYWDNGPFTSLPDLGSGGAVNDANSETYCGETYFETSPGLFGAHASIWTAAGVRQITGLNDKISRCVNLNEGGIYVGFADIPTGPTTVRRTGFIGQNGTAQLVEFPGINVTRADDINDFNRVIGSWSPDGTTRRGFISTAFQDDFADLGLLPGFTGVFPKAINNHGAIVGSVSTNTDIRALYWAPGSFEPVDLNTLVNIPGETLVEAMDINNAGQILARGFNGYYIFTPIPEPAMLGAACAVLALGRRPRQLRR